MLQRLSIHNYALIDAIDIDFNEGLSIITGETGAGKSIMLGALSLILGGRADTKIMRDSSKKSVVEASFDISKYEIDDFFAENDIEKSDNELILRREILASGRSRAFVNDSPVNARQLDEIAKRLIDIHSQHQNLLLADCKYQLQIIDSLADDNAELSAYKEHFKKYVTIHSRLQTLRDSITKSKENEAFLRFQLEQLQKLNVKKGEQESLEQQYEILSGSEDIQEKLSSGIEALHDSDTSALSRLKEAQLQLSKINLELLEQRKGEGSDLITRLESAYLEVKDIAETINSYLSKVNSDPRMLEKIDNRLNLIYETTRRFKVSSADELVTLRSNLEEQLQSFDGADDQISTLEKDLKREGLKLKEAANTLSEIRRIAAEKFSTELMEMAKPLGMNNIKFSAVITSGRLTIDGQDKVEFFCAFNKNQNLQPISKVASGGEISRIMLCIKTIVANKIQLPTIIFDEVDTGVSGEIANRMGDMMKDIARNIQVITITHLPQVASKGGNHYKVYKTDAEDSTITKVKHLDKEERLRELARMLSGSKIDDAAIKNAESLLNQ